MRAVAALWVVLGAAVAGPASAEPRHDFELYDLSDRLVRLAAVRQAARLTVVDFFSESCAPCKRALDAWRKLHQRYGPRGLALVIVAVPDGDAADRDRALARVQRHFAKHPMPFSVVWDRYLLAARRYRVAAKGTLRLPQAFLLSRSGRLLRRATGPKALAAEIARRLR
jgi:thiol-disulfide isomerase/thioredoxin